jgi:hypothetical protein
MPTHIHPVPVVHLLLRLHPCTHREYDALSWIDLPHSNSLPTPSSVSGRCVGHSRDCCCTHERRRHYSSRMSYNNKNTSPASHTSLISKQKPTHFSGEYGSNLLWDTIILLLYTATTAILLYCCYCDHPVRDSNRTVVVVGILWKVYVCIVLYSLHC